MKNPIKIIENSKTGQVVTMKTITDKRNGEQREVGSIMVQQKSLTGMGRLMRVSSRTAYLTLEQDALEFLSDYLTNGAELPFEGRLVVQETLEPYVKKDGSLQDPKINPTTQEVITYKGKPVYRNTFFSEDTSVKDIFLKDSPDSNSGSDVIE